MISLGQNAIPFHDLEAIAKSISGQNEFYTDLLNFLEKWFSEMNHFVVHTSGSTGTPKMIELSRDSILKSAQRSIDHFDLSPGKRSLLCMSTRYIAGKLMVVRAIESNLRLDVVIPSSNPMSQIDHELDFVAMTPMQLDGIISNDPGKLKLIKKILLGGSSVSRNLLKLIPDLHTEVYHGYGMTETLTHVALKKLSVPSDNYFKAIKGIHFEKDDRGCLIIHDNIIGHIIVTNDVIDLADPYLMKWLGRIDHVINSGGIKIHPELMEESLENYLNARVLVMSEKDEKLGEKMLLIAEMENDEMDVLNLSNYIKTMFTKYHIPKLIYTIPGFFELDSTKIDRAKTLYLARERGRKFIL